MEVIEAMRRRRSVRSYRHEPIPEALLQKVFGAATLAPSGGNMQPWEFFVVRNEKIKRGIVEASYTGYGRSGSPQTWLLDVPVLVVICVDRKRTGARYGREGAQFISLLDVASAVQNLLLAATAEGLGSCWVAGFDRSRVKKLLKLEPNLGVIGLVALGRTDHVPAAPYRLPVCEVVHYLS
jgi:nitroreductase